jgi:hypothetical protein
MLQRLGAVHWNSVHPTELSVFAVCVQASRTARRWIGFKLWFVIKATAAMLGVMLSVYTMVSVYTMIPIAWRAEALLHLACALASTACAHAGAQWLPNDSSKVRAHVLMLSDDALRLCSVAMHAHS